MKSENTVWHNGGISKEKRQNRNGHKSMIIWLTGLSGSGKSTLSVELEKRLFESGRQVYRLDGDNLRHGLNSNLGFSEKDRNENIRRVGETAKLFVDAGTIVLTAFISPYQKDREWVKSIVEEGEFIEVYMNASLEECEKRDPKGLYRKARAGEIKGFTGIDAPYETPLSPALVIDTETETVEQSAEKVLAYLRERKYI
ncbi:adenylyl-sulfate kinase [Rossellomorea vietnamensis]|uniref:Adenylyl-sulfate kinase n=1 Tax=Rossellomorea vietnamensis TaxID=218284 RepID=A0A5D4NLP1_9BACI|nr:adenylyl-sulfate kinase [Rossellomorea vietnamensis]TYS15195.1 adenylyl-sulfate kinase [Rossellomorea vietnamensis]